MEKKTNEKEVYADDLTEEETRLFMKQTEEHRDRFDEAKMKRMLYKQSHRKRKQKPL